MAYVAPCETFRFASRNERFILVVFAAVVRAELRNGPGVGLGYRTYPLIIPSRSRSERVQGSSRRQVPVARAGAFFGCAFGAPQNEAEGGFGSK